MESRRLEETRSEPGGNTEVGERWWVQETQRGRVQEVGVLWRSRGDKDWHLLLDGCNC
jgi:hypothetical protein